MSSADWVRLPYDGPLDWPLLLEYFAVRAIGGVEEVDLASGTYRRSVVVDGTPQVLSVRSGGDGALLAHLSAGGRLEGDTLTRARAVFALDRDPRPAVAHLRADPDLAVLLAAAPGLRVPGTWDPYETGVRAIVGQQVSVAGASTVAARIVQRVGSPIGQVDGRLTHLFPAPATLATADLAGIGMPGARVAAIQAFAGAVAAGEILLDPSASLDEVERSITAIRGLGPWTAGYIALRLGLSDAFPAADLGLRKGLSPTAPLSTAALEARAAAWRPWRGHAALCLWVVAPAGGVP